MKIGNSVYLDVDIRVGDKVYRSNNYGIYSDVGVKFVSGDGEVVELVVFYEFGSLYDISINKFVNVS